MTSDFAFWHLLSELTSKEDMNVPKYIIAWKKHWGIQKADSRFQENNTEALANLANMFCMETKNFVMFFTEPHFSHATNFSSIHLNKCNTLQMT